MSEEPRLLWIVMKAFSWGAVQIGGGIPLGTPPGGPQRFLPVFNSREEAMAWAPGEELGTIQTLEEKGGDG